ncbi:LysR substrate-binding domain-containing protein [Consotaella aegiceratis]|uniref:LysR substrate-binding domain-containing protein n=1 Tax=Consotaella aegiceratis TaxID=3097961 RepID=UPI002F41C529
MQGVDIRHLRYFLRVAEELHFGRAAEVLGVSQAPLSQQIRQLEERLGVRLFDRTTRTVRLTPAGKVMCEKAQATLAALEETIRETRSAGGHNAGRLDIGAVSVAIHTCLPAAFADFCGRNPSVQVDMQLHTTEEQLVLLKERKIDVAFVRPPRSLAGIACEELYREGFVAVLPAASPLAAKENLTLADLRDERFITFSPIIGVSYQDVMLDHCRRAGFRPNIVQQVSHTLTVVTLAAAGLGVGVVPAWVTYEPVDGVVYRPVAELPKAVSLVVAWSIETMNPFVTDFVACTRRAARAALQAA